MVFNVHTIISAFLRASTKLDAARVLEVAPTYSPTFTGAPVVPTAPSGTSTGQAASTAFVSQVKSDAQNYAGNVATAARDEAIAAASADATTKANAAQAAAILAANNAVGALVIPAFDITTSVSAPANHILPWYDPTVGALSDWSTQAGAWVRRVALSGVPANAFLAANGSPFRNANGDYYLTV